MTFIHFTLAIPMSLNYCAGCGCFYALVYLKLLPESWCATCMIDFRVEDETLKSPRANSNDDCSSSIEMQFEASSKEVSRL